MLNQRTKISMKIISLILAQVFLCTSLGYSVSDSIYIKTKVRLPIAFSDSSEDKDRAIGLTVIERIRELQATGIRSDTINRKIKQEFNESKYHLQERIRIGNNNFYVQAGSEYFEIVNGEVKKIDKVTFDQGRRILVKVVRGPDSKEKFDSEIREVASGLRRKLKRLPNIREVAKAMPSLETSRNPVALLYKYLEGKDVSAYGIGKFSGKANIVIKKSFAFAGTRIFLPRQLYKMVQISAEKTPISKETKIDIVDIRHPENRLTLEHIKETDVLRLTYIQPSSKKITADITGINGKTSVTLALNPVFSDFYDTVFSIPLYPSRERLKAVAEHLRNRKFGTYSTQEERHVNFHGQLYLPLFYYTHPGRIRIYRDRESWVRFLVLEDVANPNNIVGYEWRENRIIPLERGSALKIDNYVSIDSGRKMLLYYLHKSSVFREFDQRLDKSVEVKIATPNDTRLSDIAIGRGRFSFRVRRNVSVISFEGQRSPDNITRDDRGRYPIRIVRSDDKSEIRIGYRNPDVQGEFVVDGLNWEDGSPVVLKCPAGYKGKREYFNLSTIIEMLRQDLLPGIEASNWLLETFSFYEGPEGAGLRNPIRSYKIEETSSGEKVLVEDIFVDPKTFEPWHDQKSNEAEPGGNLASNASLQMENLALLDIGALRGDFLRGVARLNPNAGKLVGIDKVTRDEKFLEGDVEIELRNVDTQGGNVTRLVEEKHYDVVTICYPDASSIPDLMSLLSVAAYAIKPDGVLYIVADSEAFASQLKNRMDIARGLFTDIKILDLPEDWPISKHVIVTGSREDHRLVVAKRARPGALRDTTRGAISGPELSEAEKARWLWEVRDKAASAEIIIDNSRIVEMVKERGTGLCRELKLFKIITSLKRLGLSNKEAIGQMRLAMEALKNPDVQFRWFKTRVAAKEKYLLGDRCTLAIDLIVYLWAEEKRGDCGDLIDEYLMHEALEKTVLGDSPRGHRLIIEITSKMFKRPVAKFPNGDIIHSSTPLGRAIRQFIDMQAEEKPFRDDFVLDENIVTQNLQFLLKLADTRNAFLERPDSEYMDTYGTWKAYIDATGEIKEKGSDIVIILWDQDGHIAEVASKKKLNSNVYEALTRFNMIIDKELIEARYEQDAVLQLCKVLGDVPPDISDEALDVLVKAKLSESPNIASGIDRIITLFKPARNVLLDASVIKIFYEDLTTMRIFLAAVHCRAEQRINGEVFLSGRDIKGKFIFKALRLAGILEEALSPEVLHSINAASSSRSGLLRVPMAANSKRLLNATKKASELNMRDRLERTPTDI